MLLLWYLNELANLLLTLGSQGHQQGVPLYLAVDLPTEELSIPQQGLQLAV